MESSAVTRDLDAYYAAIGECWLRRPTHDLPPTAGTAAIDGELRERVADHLQRAHVAAAFAAARRGHGREEAEPARQRLRALAPAWLDLHAEEARREIDARRAERRRGQGEVEAFLARTADPVERARRYAAWLDEERSAESAVAAWREARESAARSAGAAAVVELLGAAHPAPPASLLRPFEAGAIEPLDRAVLRAAAEQQRRYGLQPGPACDPAAVPALDALQAHRELWEQRRIPAALRRLGAAIGADPDAGGPSLLEARPAPARSRIVQERAGRTCLVLGDVGGPAGWWEALGCFGAAARRCFLGARRGSAAARFADPAFDFAAATLFRRLALCPRFRDWVGLAQPPELMGDLCLQEAVVPRRAWSYLSLVAERVAPDAARIDETMLRCRGAPATPPVRRRVAAGDPAGAAELRGTVLGLLVEERLRSRHDRDWYCKRAARDALREMWEAEPEQTAEEMARGLGLGTIEPTPVLDRCRPDRPS